MMMSPRCARTSGPDMAVVSSGFERKSTVIHRTDRMKEKEVFHRLLAVDDRKLKTMPLFIKIDEG